MTNIVNRLAKVWSSTEDATFKEHLTPVLHHFKKMQLSLSSNAKAPVILLEFPPFKELADYCNEQVASIKPSWQVIAERRGWIPGEAKANI